MTIVRRTPLALGAIAVLGFAFALAAQPSTVAWRAVAAGVEHAAIVRDGPLSIHVLRVDPARARLDVVHALDAAVGLETVSSIAERLGAIAAVNGGYFRTTGTFRGDSTGTLQIDRAILSEPDRGRAAVGLVRDGQTTRLVFGHVAWEGAVSAGARKRALDGVNRARGKDEVVLFTREFHRTTLTDSSGTEVVVRAGRVTEIRDAAGSTTLPSDGFVISTTGTARAWARETLRKGTRVSVSVALKPVDASSANPWKNAEDILGAGPKLVTAGRVDVTTAREKIRAGFDTELHPRTAIGVQSDGRVLLLVVDGRQPPLSVGMALEPLARLFIELGAVDAMNLDGGGSTAMVVQGKVVNSPSDPTGERPVSDAIVIRQ